MVNSSLLDILSLDGPVVPNEVVAKISRDSGNDIDFKCCHCATPFQYGGEYREKEGDPKYKK